jgi:ATP-binding cassette subfamily B protein
VKTQAESLHTSTWVEVRRLLHPWRGQIVLITLGVLIYEGLSVIPPLLLQRIIDDHLVPGLATGILVLALLYLAVIMLAEVFNFGITYLTAWVAQHALLKLRVINCAWICLPTCSNSHLAITTILRWAM